MRIRAKPHPAVGGIVIECASLPSSPVGVAVDVAVVVVVAVLEINCLRRERRRFAVLDPCTTGRRCQRQLRVRLSMMIPGAVHRHRWASAAMAMVMVCNCRL